MKALRLHIGFCLLAAGLLAAPAAQADDGALGNDVSWPQCQTWTGVVPAEVGAADTGAPGTGAADTGAAGGSGLPGGSRFLVVGVNNGMPGTANPCLQSQLGLTHDRATTAASSDRQPGPRIPVSLYLNTGIPATDWTGEVNGSPAPSNPYGDCGGGGTAACAYQYGYDQASQDVTNSGIYRPAAHRWWLDVEILNAWSTDRGINAAVLEGMTAFFQGIGAHVGIYSSPYQWQEIVGEVSPNSNLYDLPSWLAGPTDPDSAREACSAPPLVPGGTVAMTQFTTDDLDYDYQCPLPERPSLPLRPFS